MSFANYRDQVVVIIDATTPFAQVCATSLIASGARLVLNYPPSSGSTQSLIPALEEGSRTQAQVIKTYQEPEDADKLIAAAIKCYHTVHCVIYNVPFLGSGASYDLQSETSWDSMQSSILFGAFKCAKAVWPDFREKNYGRFVFVDSQPTQLGVAEFAGRFALLGFAQTLAKEGVKHNIRVNVVAAQAPYNVTGQLLSSHPMPKLQSAVNLALMIGDQSNKDPAGSLYEIRGDDFAKLQWERSKGIFMNPDVEFTAGSLASKWNQVHDFSEKTYSDSPMDFGKLLPEMQALPGNLQLPSPDFSDKVVVVTGGASGLGRAYALAFSKLGASVVINDLNDPQAVVDEIKQNGGKATPVIASVDQGEYIVQKALSVYGRIDVLVNNAGFVRDKSFAKMEDAHWHSVINVHVNGTYRMIKAAWPYFVRQRHGCIINTTSTSGIYGNFGQSNYSAAKLGILGISEATAREGKRHNIRVNTIAPVASTGGLAVALSNTNDKNNQPVFLPEYIAPIVLLLSSETLNGKPNETTGGLFEVGCGWHASTRLRPVADFRLTPTATGSELGKQNAVITSPKEADRDVLETINGLKRVDVEHNEYKYTDNEVLLYNLAVGAKRLEAPLVWEESSSFQAVPTFGVIPFFSMETIYHHAQILPNFKVTGSLLGEAYLEILQDSIPTSGHLSTTRRLVEILDKETAAVGITSYTTRDVQTGRPLFYNEISFFMRGAGGFGGIRDRPHQTPSSRKYIMPRRKPDAIDEFRTSEEQAAWYRLTGDRMAMHIDPGFSSKGGFPLPILHGFCGMGIAGKLLFQRYGPYRSIKVKLSAPAVPGQTLRVESWRSEVEKDLVVFQVAVVETGKLFITGGGIRLRHPMSPGKASSKL